MSERGRYTHHASGEKPVKVLFVAHGSGISGAERVLINITRFLQSTRFVPLVAMPHPGDLSEALEAQGVKVVILPLVQWMPYTWSRRRWHLRVLVQGLPARVRRMTRLIYEEDIGLVHSNVGVIIEGAIAARLTGRPHLWHIHSAIRETAEVKSWVPYGLVPYIFVGLSDRILCVSKATRDFVFPHHLRSRAMTCYNGIDVDHLSLSPPTRDLRVELGLPPGTLLFGLLGTVTERKRQLDFIEAAARTRKELPDAHFILAGHGDAGRTYFIQVQERIRWLNVGKYIHYLGYRHDYGDVMKSLDVYVQASAREEMPLVVMEAMACGKPVVATACGGTAEAVVDGETGLLVPVGRVDELARAMVAIGSAPDRGRAMGARGRERVGRFFDHRKCLAALPELYEELLGAASNNGVPGRTRESPSGSATTSL